MGTSASAWATQAQALITSALSFGDVILMRDHQPYAPSYALPNDADYTAATHALGVTYNIPVFDIPARLGTGAQANALGLFDPAGVHYNALGWQDIGGWLATMIASL